MYLKIQPGKEQYAKLAELAIGGGHLDKFIVSHKSDLELLKKFRKQVGCGFRDCSLYAIHPKSTKEKYRTPAPLDGVETVTSVISCENAMVFNYLVDNAKIDESALVDSKVASERALLVTDANGNETIRGHVKKAYFYPDGDHWEIRGGNRTMVANDKNMKQTIGVDKTKAIDSAKHELKAIEQELKRNQKEEQDVKDASLDVSLCYLVWPCNLSL
jgi:chromosome segregation ATPase